LILLDTSGLLAAIDADQRRHEECARALRNAEPPFLLSPFVLAEVDYLLLTRVSSQAELAVLEEVANGAYQLEPFDGDDVASALEVVTKYKDKDLGLADASIVVLAQRYSVWDVLTLDERHFRSVRTSDGRLFRLLPMDVA
jgi:predicted nucleic acid-binding protein